MAAVTADTVTVRLEAQVSKYLSDLRAAESQSNSTATALARAANTAAAAITQQSRAALEALRATGNASAAEIQAAQATLQKARASEQATRAEVRRVAALRAEAAAQSSVGESAQTAANQVTAATARADAATSSLNTGNIAAQFQDIGVTAAAGMNPLIIALQQGTQLSAVLNESVGRGVSPVKALGAAFLQVINPISLATIAAVALGAAAIQYFSTILTEGPDSEAELKKQEDVIRSLAERWGEAVPALQAYVDQLDRVKEAEEALEARGVIGRDLFSGLSDDLDTIRDDVNATADQLFALGVQGAGAADELQASFTSLEQKIEDGTATTEDFQRLTNAVAEAARGNAVPALSGLQTTLTNLTPSFAAAADAAANFNAQIGGQLDEGLQNYRRVIEQQKFVEGQRELNTLTADELALRRKIDSIQADVKRTTGGELDAAEAKKLAEETLAAEKARADLKKSSTKDNRDYGRERQEITDLLAAMGLEAALLGQTNREKAIAIALSKANATATQEELDLIQKQAGFIYDTEQALKNLNETSTEWANTIQSATRSFIDDLIEGKSAAEAFSNVLSNIANKLLDVGLNNLFGGSGLNLSGLFGGTATRANGGSVYAGVPVQVNERGQEMFIPTQPGRIVPASQVGGGGSVTFSPQIDARGADVAAVARLEGVVQKLAADLVPAIRREMATAGKKGR